MTQNYSPLSLEFSYDLAKLSELFSAYVNSSKNLAKVASQSAGRVTEVNYRAARYVCKFGPIPAATSRFKSIMTNGERFRPPIEHSNRIGRYRKNGPSNAAGCCRFAQLGRRNL